MGLFWNEKIKKTPEEKIFEKKLNAILIELEALVSEASVEYKDKKITRAELMNIFSQRCRELGLHSDLITYFGSRVAADIVQSYIDATILIYVQVVEANIRVKSD